MNFSHLEAVVENAFSDKIGSVTAARGMPSSLRRRPTWRKPGTALNTVHHVRGISSGKHRLDVCMHEKVSQALETYKSGLVIAESKRKDLKRQSLL
jgi:hypothetical protein